MTTEQILLLAAARKHAETGSGRAIRTQARLTLAEVAATLGVSEPAVSRWENGLQMPRTKAAIRWAKLLRKLEKSAKTDRVAA
jgi:transcriptional regulator with XRE-family HTH domain